MSQNSLIHWTQATWNPTLGCSKLGEGCRNCFAIRDVHRMSRNPNPKIAAANADLTREVNGRAEWTNVVRCLPERLDAPLHWRKPLRIFVNSLSDLFHPDVPDEFIDQVFAVMMAVGQHTFQVLTKRAERLREYFAPGAEELTDRWALQLEAISEHHFQALDDDTGTEYPLPNVWIGTSIENQTTADERVPFIIEVPAAVRFLSIEPLLGPIDLTPPEYRGTNINTDQWLQELQWIIVGGESGKHSRPMHPDWVRTIRDRCARRTDMGRPWPLPFFFKQWGSHLPAEWTYGQRWKWQDGAFTNGCGTATGKDIRLTDGPEHTPCIARKMSPARAGRQLDGRTHDEYPAVPHA